MTLETKGQKMQDKTVALDAEVYDYVLTEAKRNHRTIKGQISYMVDIARQQEERLAQIRAGQSQIDFSDNDAVERSR